MAKIKEAAKQLEQEETEKDSAELAAETLVGDVRDMMLDTIRYGKDQKSWAQMSEDEQSELIERVSGAAERMVRKAVHVIANKGFRSSFVEIASWKVKGKSLEASIKTVANDENVMNFHSVSGQLVALVFASDEEFDQNRKPCEPEPDQPVLAIDDNEREAV